MEKRSQKALRENDRKVSKTLKFKDNVAVGIFFAIPVILALIGGKRLATCVIFIWPPYCLAYIVMFRRHLRQYSSEEMRLIARLGNQYVFYSLAWIFFIGALCMLILELIRMMKIF